jgi:hypothetical protein
MANTTGLAANVSSLSGSSRIMGNANHPLAAVICRAIAR